MKSRIEIENAKWWYVKDKSGIKTFWEGMKLLGFFILIFVFFALMVALVKKVTIEFHRVAKAKEAENTNIASIAGVVDSLVKSKYPSLHWMDPEEADALAESSEGYDIRCLAQVMAGEANDPNAMTVVGWSVRYRVEANNEEVFGLGYCGVAYKPHQFSGLNKFSPSGKKNERYELNVSRDYDMIHESIVEQRNWEKAIRRAVEVYDAKEEVSPLRSDTWNFYSPSSMKDGGVPNWAKGCKAYLLIRDPDNQLNGKIDFAFYRGSTCPRLREHFKLKGLVP